MRKKVCLLAGVTDLPPVVPPIGSATVPMTAAWRWAASFAAHRPTVHNIGILALLCTTSGS